MNSGEVDGSHVIVSGSNYARVRLNWQLASQNTAGNYSTINWQLYVDFYACDASLSAATANNNNGQFYSNSGTYYSYAGNFSNHTVTVATGSFNVNHNSDGTYTLNLSASTAVYGSGTSSGSGSWALPTIPRYASITSFTQSVTDEALTAVWHSSDPVSAITWWSTAYDGGTHHDTAASGNGDFTETLHNLKSGATYDFTVGIKRSDSGLWTFSSTVNLTTLLQNNFFGVRVPR